MDAEKEVIVMCVTSSVTLSKVHLHDNCSKCNVLTTVLPVL
jgi:hypothetical protein